ncbi:MAG: hypothetical protein HYR76_06310 [Ignavibacteria bacterium]|nr:hypothetical protein [Ignavibacteria bacterium]
MDFRDVDIDSLSSHWLTFHQLSSGSLVDGVKRLGPAGMARCTSASLCLEGHKWELPHDEMRGMSLESVLMALVNPMLGRSQTLSLGVSGGMDSRFLLCLLRGCPHQTYHIHTFGHPDDPDVHLAKRIAKGEQLSYLHLHESIPDVDQCLKALKEYMAYNCATEPASSVLKMRYFPHIHELDRVVIDGGFGEIARRQYFNRLLRLGKQAFHSGDPRKIAPYFRVHRAKIFNEEIIRSMESTIVQHIDYLWTQMPDMIQIGDENFLDLLAIRTRFPNWGAYEQSRMDSMVLNYMPFAQPSFLRKMFQVPVQVRKNGRLFREIIKRRSPSLASYPLVKGGTTYPFGMSTLTSQLWTRLKKKVGITFKNVMPVKFLHHLSEFVKDTAHSREVKNSSLYDHSYIVKIVDQFYHGKLELATEVDWWLAFEVWRQGIVNGIK